MQQLSKIVTRQDANFKLSPSASNETSINLSKEISALISDESGEVTFTLYKSDFIKALSALCLIPRIYFKKEQQPSSLSEIFSGLSAQIAAQFGDNDTADYSIYHFKRDDGRAYFNNLKRSNGFNLRAFLVEQYAILTFERSDNGHLTIRLNIETPEQEEKREFNIVEETSFFDEPLQLIYFGAPGTGKSHRIKQVCKKYEHYRITFHPDTDYASFVGSYKPITHKEQVYTNMGDKAIPLKDSVTGEPVTTTKITYQYVYQAFLNAYIAAWREQQNDEPKSVYLVIEEINRGNCAQIFGDIFQLLDRNDFGFSDYPIVADNDLKKELAREFADLEVVNADTINDIYDDGMVAKIKSGSHLLLPNNLHIWATMNTSDQSLFPIDSAFKRRWEWKYVKIADSGMNYRIAVNGKEYNWWEFVQAINAVIGSEIEQEDKKLGYFFAKAKKNAEGKWIISANTLLSKVLFFIYNDVFKDYGFDYEMFKGEDDKPMTFADYFDEHGDTIEPRVERFVLNLGLSPLSSDETVVDEEASGNDADYKTIKVNVNGEQKTTMTTAMIAILEDVARSHSMDEIESAVKEYITRGDDPIIKRIDNPDTYTKENRWNKTIIRSSDGVAFVVTTMWLRRFLPMIEKLAEHFNVPFEVVNP
ncbi:AAA family ATPase [uncultured Bacteroides sp.]|uniref:AAA family ATPase n=1 Tax=uncultured Bacteroides sp. TaxID=162156 RepID=UPI0025936D2C|nr:AAA family ATPase [uncultured Bacteroides sp.]